MKRKNSIQINRHISIETKKLLESFEKEGITLDYIIKDYARLKQLETDLFIKIDKKLNLVLKGLKMKYKDKPSLSLLQKIKNLIKMK